MASLGADGGDLVVTVEIDGGGPGRLAVTVPEDPAVAILVDRAHAA